VKAKRVKQWMWPAIGLSAIFLILLVIFPGQMQRLIVRVVAPFSDLGNAGAVRFTIAPQDVEVLEGDEVIILIQYSDPSAKELNLVMAREGMETLTERIQAVRVEQGESVFEYRLPAAKESFHYHARIGRAQSDGFDVTVSPLPRIEGIEIEYVFPEYTNRARQRRSLDPGVKALAGTTVELRGLTNTPVESGKLLVDGREMGTVTVEPDAKGGRVNIEWTLVPESSGMAQVMLHHRLDREIEGIRFPVMVLKDQVPEVTLVSPTTRETRVRTDEQILFEYEVREDVGVRGALVELEVNGEKAASLPGDLPEEDSLSPSPLWRGEQVVSIGALLDERKDARELRMRIAVSDTLPKSMGGPGIGYSEWRVFHIDRNAESLVRQELRAQQSGVAQARDEEGGDHGAGGKTLCGSAGETGQCAGTVDGIGGAHGSGRACRQGA
jgi:hypothetical protein